jgi:hypothetical protein
MRAGRLVRPAVQVFLLLALGLVAGLLMSRRFRRREAVSSPARPSACESCPLVWPDCTCKEGSRAP